MQRTPSQSCRDNTLQIWPSSVLVHLAVPVMRLQYRHSLLLGLEAWHAHTQSSEGCIAARRGPEARA